jgi:hypothetical protein
MKSESDQLRSRTAGSNHHLPSRASSYIHRPSYYAYNDFSPSYTSLEPCEPSTSHVAQIRDRVEVEPVGHERVGELNFVSVARPDPGLYLARLPPRRLCHFASFSPKSPSLRRVLVHLSGADT